MGREFELKYAVGEAGFAALQQHYPNGRAICMETTYFDTPARDFSSRRMTLRLRKENQQTVCTLKTPLPDGSRGEWECEASDITAGLAILVSLGAPAEILQLAVGGLEPVCGARFTRLASEIRLDGGVAELALDSGVLLGGGQELPFREVEVELKEGADQAILIFAAQLAKAYNLVPESKSKFRRAMALAQGE